MILVILTAVLAACGAAKLDRSYLPPISAKTAGGSPGDLQAPVDGLPSGSYTNDAQGVVVDAATPGTRTSGAETTGLGGPRTSYGSTNSKVGDAAFRGSLTGFGSAGGPNTRIAPGFGSITGADENATGPSIRIAPSFSSIVASGGTDDDKTRASTLKFANEIGLENYSYGFETDNGISIGENGVASDGIKANGEYSYKGDDGKVYSVSYTADEGGYRPQGSHLPTSPPIPDEILKSLEQNAKEEAAGIVDDGTYNAQKYNEEGDYTSNNGDGNNNRPSVSGGDATASGSFVTHSNQGIKHNVGGHGVGSYQPGSTGQGFHGFGSHAAGNKQTGFGISGDSASSGLQHGHAPHFSQNQLGATHQFGVQATGPQGPNVGSGFHSHTNQNRFGVQPVNPTSATAFASTENGQGLASPTRIPSLHSHSGLRLPSSSNSNTAYSSASTTGSGSASAFASTGSVGTVFKNQYPNTGSTGSPAPGSKFGSDSTGGASFSNFEAINPNDPSSATASASAQGQGALAEALSTNSPSFGGSKFNKAPVSTHSTFGSNAYSQNTQANGLTINEYLPPVNIVEPTGQVPHGSNAHGAASSGSFPSAGKPNEPTNLHGTDAATAASNFGSQQPGFSSPSSFNSRPGQYTQTGSTFPTALGQSQFPNANIGPSSAQPTQPTFGSPSAATPTNVPITGQLSSITPTQHTISLPSQQLNNFGSNFPSHSGQYKPQTTQGSYTQTGSNDVNFSPSSPKPTLSQQQGSDSSYYYNPPAKPFVTPISQYQIAQFPSNFGSSAISSSGQNSNNRPSNAPIASLSQHGSKYSNTPVIGAIAPTISPQNGQYQGSTDSSYYNGITQASISPFPSAAPTLATQFGSQSSQFGSKPTTQSGGSSSQAHFGPTGNQQAFGQKPIVQSQSQYSQSSSSQTDKNYKPSQQGTLYEYNKPPSTPELVTSSQTDSQSKPIQTSFGSQATQFGNQQSKPFDNTYHANSFQHSQIQGSTFGSKPSNQFQNPQSSQNVGSISIFHNQSGQQTGQKPFGSSQTGFNYQQSQFGSSSGSSFGNKPSIQSGSQQSPLGSSVSQVGQNSFTSQTDGQQNQGTLYEYNKPDANLPSDKEEIVQGSSGTSGSQPSQGSTPTSGTQGFGSSQTGFPTQQTQFGSPTGQNPHTGLHSATSQQIKPISQFGSQSTHTQFGQKPQTTIGSSYTPNTGDNAESSKKPLSTTQTGSSFPHRQTTFGSQQTQFGQKPLTNQVTGFGNSQSGSIFQQNQLGSALGSQIGQKPQSSQGSGITSTGHTSQYGNKPVGSTQTGSIFPQSETTFGSQQPTQFGQKPSTNQVASFGSSGTGSSPGSQLIQKPQSTQATGFGSTGQTSQFGNKPFGATQTGSSYQQTQTQQTTQFGKKPLNQETEFGSSQPGILQQGNQGSSFATSIISQGQTSQFGTKPNSQFGTSFPSHFAQKPNQGSSLTSNGQPSQFGQKPLSNTQTGSSSSQTQFGSNTGSKLEQKPLTTQFGQQSFGSPQTGNQIGSSPDSKLGQNSQSTQGTGTISQSATSFGQKPSGSLQTGTSLQQTAFGSLSGSQFDQKPQTTQGSSFSFGTPSKGLSVQTTQFGLKPFSSSQPTGSNFSHVGSNTGSQFGQNQQPTGTVSQTATPFGQNPTGVSQIGSYQQSQFGSTSTSHFGQKPLSNSGSKGQSVHTTHFNVKPISSSQTSFSQTQFGSNTGSAFGQKPLSGVGTSSNTPQIKPISQYGSKPFSSQSFQGTQQQAQFGSSTVSKFGQNTGSQGQTSQTTQSGQQPSSSSPGSSFTQTQSSSSSGSQFGQKPQVQPISQFGTKPFGSQFTQSSVQQSQHDLSAGSQPAQNHGNQAQTGQIQFSQKPFGSSQATGSTFQPAQSGQTGSQFGQKPTLGSQTSSSVFSQSAQSQFSTQTKKPFDNTQSPFQSQFGSTTEQKKPQNSASAFASISGSLSGTQFGQGSKHQPSSFSSVGTQPQKPFGSSQTQTGQYTQTTGQFGTQSQKPFGSSPSIFQQSQFPGQKPFSNQGSPFQNGQALDQKTQPTQSSIQTSVTSISPQSSSQSFGNVGSFEGYNYQKPHSISSTPSTLSAFGQSQSTIGSSQFGVQPTKPSDLGTSFGSQTNQPQFNGQPFNSVSTVATPVTSFTQFGVQPTKPTFQFTGQPFKPHSTTSNQISIEQLQSAFPTSQFGVQPTQGAIVASQQHSQTSGAYNQPIKTNIYGNTQSTSLPSLGLGALDSLNQGSSVSTVQTPISILEGNKQPLNSFVGKGEVFGGPRDPPKFDDKTGYHY